MYVENRHIGESERLISDVTEISKIKKLEGFLFAMDIVKAFDSLDHNFLLPTPAKYGFDKYFILWVKILLRDQELCVTCGGTTKRSGVVCYLRRYNYKIFLIWERRPSR